MTFSNQTKTFAALAFLVLGVACCKDDNQPPIVDTGDLTDIPYSPTTYNLVIPPGFPALNIPSYNPMTVQGVELGRHLFYDPILSSDSTIACASCHQLAPSFSDVTAFSKGVDGQLGKRSSMSLINVGFFQKGMFWDGRSPSLEDQVLHPVEDPLEMAEDWANVEVKMQSHPDYPKMFREAFGIANKSEITRTLVTRAIAQFERTLISAGSKFDEGFDGDFTNLTDLEEDGRFIYFDNQNGDKDGHCAHCHDGGKLLASERFENNGIEQVSSLADFPDKGFGNVTGKMIDNGKFKAPSLRNIALTAPYMHDGRFKTLKEVVNFYNQGGIKNPHLDNTLIPLELTEQEKQDVVALLKSLNGEGWQQAIPPKSFPK